MLNRLTNLLTLAAIAAALILLVDALYEGWHSAAPWEQEWTTLPGKEPKHSSERLVKAIQSATEAGALDDVDIFVVALRADFRPTGKVFVRLNETELFYAIKVFTVALLLLLIPLSINYLRHGRFLLWNRET